MDTDIKAQKVNLRYKRLIYVTLQSQYNSQTYISDSSAVVAKTCHAGEERPHCTKLA